MKQKRWPKGAQGAAMGAQKCYGGNRRDRNGCVFWGRIPSRGYKILGFQDWKYWMIGKTARIGGLVPGI